MEEKEDSTMKAAGKLSGAIGHPLSREQRRKASPWIHYGFGAAIGSIFGLTAKMAPESLRTMNSVVTGAVYGSLVFVAADEVAVPALKLSSNPLKEPVSDQVAELISHWSMALE
jgi:putative membrane protein